MIKRCIKRLFFFLLVAGMLFSIWKLNLEGRVAPIEQRTQDGWFEGEDSQIRGLRMVLEKEVDMALPEQTDVEIWITDAVGDMVWEKVYKDVPILMNEVITLEEFEREKGIDIGTGKYQIHNSLEKDNLRITHKIYSYNGDFWHRYFICALIALLILAVILGISLRSNGKYSLAVDYFISMVLLGILFTAIMPPLSVPDEESHFYKAYELSSRMLGQEVYDSHRNRVMRQTDKDCVNYLQNAANVSYWYDTFWDNEGIETKVISTKRTTLSSTTPDHAYLFPAIGISLARILKVNGHILILLGRFFNLLAVAAVMSVSVYLIPIGKKFFCVAGLLPEVIYLSASYSYDAINFSLCFLAIAYFFYMIADEKPVKVNNLLIFLLIVILMIPIKLVYAPLLGLVFLISGSQLAVNKKLLTAIIAIGVLGAVSLLIIRGKDIVVLLNGLDYNNTEERTVVSLSYVLHNLKSTIIVFASNLMGNFDYYLKSIMGEFVGSARSEALYALDRTYLPEWMGIGIGILMALGIYTDTQYNDLKLWKRVWLLMLALVCCFLFMFSMYLSNNTIDMNYIHGVQGRYFLPVLWLLPMILGAKREPLPLSNGEQGKNSYLLLMAGIDIIAIFVQFMHMAGSYFN